MGQSPNGACYTDNPNDAVLVQGNADLKDGWVFPRVWTTEITKTAKAGDLIMSVRAPVGAMGKTAYDVVLGRGVAGIVGNEFLFQALSKKEAEGYWSTVSAGSTFDSINGDELRNTPVDYPRSKPEREAVGSCLSRIDCLITLHQRECGKPPFNQSPAWEQRKWSEYVSISTDMVDPRSGNYDNLPHVGPGNMESFTGRLYDNVNTVKDDALISGKFHFNPGDIIYGKINPQLGKYTYAQFEGLASADAYVLNGKNGLTQEFLFGILQTKAFFDYSVSVSMRSGMPKINRDELNAFEFLAPNESEQRAIGDILLKLDDLITLHQRMCPIFSFCAHGSRTNFAQTLQGWLQILRYPRPIPKMLVSPSAPASGVFGTAKGAFICASSSAGASTSSPSARKNFITSSTLCCRESLSSP